MEVLRLATNTSMLAMDTRSSLDHPDCVDDENEAQVSHMDRMKSEQQRLNTFATWPPGLSQRPAELARAGLFYTLTDDRVQCPFCHGVLKQWLPSDNPLSEHSRHFPQCRFIRGYDVGNIPISSNYVNTIPLQQPSANVSNFGNVSSAALNIVPPFSTHIVTARENRIFPNNTPQSTEQHSAYPGLDVTQEENRLATYKEWPQDRLQRPEVLARAGFYHIPNAEKPDRVKCAYCNGKLYNWQPEDDPHMEHAKCFPNCPYIAICLGEDVIRDLRNTPQPTTSQNVTQPSGIQFEFQPAPVQQPPTRSAEPPTPNCDTLDVRMRSEPVQAVLEMGFREDLVRQSVENCLRERRGNFPPAEDLASLVMELEDREQATVTTSGTAATPSTPLQRLMAAQGVATSAKTTTGSTAGPSQDQIWREYREPTVNPTEIREENARMRDQYLCKVCMENQVRVTFLPCGHLACCGPCSMAVSECPICRTHISGCVRTFF